MIATHVLSKNDYSINPVPKTNEYGKSNKKSTMFLYQWIDPIRLFNFLKLIIAKLIKLTALPPIFKFAKAIPPF
jgi:hypothetical protein